MSKLIRNVQLKDIKIINKSIDVMCCNKKMLANLPPYWVHFFFLFRPNTIKCILYIESMPKFN